jgi:HK97 gp10 family phage protein
MAATLKYVKGLEGLLATLKALPPEIVSKGGGPVRTAARLSLKQMQRDAIQNVQLIVDQPNKDGSTPTNSKTLEKAIIISRRKPGAGFQGEIFSLRVKRGARAPNGQTANKYGGILEFGYEGVPAKAWLRRAFEANKDTAVTVFTSELTKRIEAATRKARKQGLLT